MQNGTHEAEDTVLMAENKDVLQRILYRFQTIMSGNLKRTYQMQLSPSWQTNTYLELQTSIAKL